MVINNENRDSLPEESREARSGEFMNEKSWRCPPEQDISYEDTEDAFLLSSDIDPPAYSPQGQTSSYSCGPQTLGGRTTTSTGYNHSQSSNPFLPQTQLHNIQGTTRKRYPRLPILVIMAICMMASFTWLAHILLFLLPYLASLSQGSSVGVSPPSPPPPLSSPSPSPSLGDLALQKVLADAAGVFGPPNPIVKTDEKGGKGTKKSQNRSNWMSLLPDSTPLTQINIPGTHDSATWNFTQTNADTIRHNINPENGVLPAEIYRCQRVSLHGALEAGVRFFDLRYGLDPDGVRLVFYHAHALMSELSTVEDVLFGFYNWLEGHKTEVVILSLKIEDTGINTTPQDHLKAQFLLYQTLTTPAAKKYIHQRHDSLGTLGPARGKVILFRRFDNPFDPSGGGQGKETVLPGLHLSPSVWTENSRGFALLYNAERNYSAHIEDYYEPRDLMPPNLNASVNIGAKVDAVRRHLDLAAAASSPRFDRAEGQEEEGNLFITFTSAEHSANIPSVTPIIMALGNGTEYTPEGGMNRQLVKDILPALKGKRVGIVIIDFWDGLDLDGRGYEDGEEDVVGVILDL
ncbi:PLC-like phosphodiesterase, TIM beta/alpha-barrel-containing domain containing protein [Naviculisporaceae sp. PSN 640]